MKRTRLRFESVQQLKGSDEIGIILLTDMERKNAITLVCDAAMMHQITLRINAPEQCEDMLPEVLFSLLPSKYELMVFGLFQGQYQVVLMSDKGASTRMRMSDAVLLMLLSDIPLYMEEKLMKRQSTPFDETTARIAVPINTMDESRLKAALENAIAEENYELASQLRDEIKRRNTPAIPSSTTTTF